VNASLLFPRGVDFEIMPLTPEDCADAAALHAHSFPRPWSDGEIGALVRQEAVFGYMARRPGRFLRTLPGGFVLARLAADEAEILTLTVRPKNRQAGIGWRLMGAVLRHLHAEGVRFLFLEVDETNDAAIALYSKLGFERIAERAAYYDRDGGGKTAALVMRLDLG